MQIVNHNFKISIINISIGTQRRTLRPPRSAPAFSRFGNKKIKKTRLEIPRREIKNGKMGSNSLQI